MKTMSVQTRMIMQIISSNKCYLSYLGWTYNIELSSCTGFYEAAAEAWAAPSFDFSAAAFAASASWTNFRLLRQAVI